METFTSLIKRLIFDNLSGLSLGMIALFVYNLFLAALMGYLLSWLYVRFANSISNRRLFARNFVLLTTTTMLVITFVKESLALSLGLVGALSIIRFRSAIKEPEELAYLFLCIAIGIGCGAGYSSLTFLSLFLIALFVVLIKWRKPKLEQNLLLSISSSNLEKISSENIDKIVKKHSEEAQLKRLHESKNELEMVYSTLFKDIQQINLLKENIQREDDSAIFTYVNGRSNI